MGNMNPAVETVFRRSESSRATTFHVGDFDEIDVGARPAGLNPILFDPWEMNTGTVRACKPSKSLQSGFGAKRSFPARAGCGSARSE